MRKTVVCLLAVLLAGVGAASHGAEAVEVDPGVITSDSPLYGMDVAVDNAAMSLGVSDPGQVAQERASEVHRAAERGDTDAVERAAEELNNVSEVATSDHEHGLAKAEAILQEVNVPEEAGVSTALENVQAAKERAPENPGGQPDDSGSDGNAPL